MSSAEVFELSRGYFVCELIPKPDGGRSARLQVFSTALTEGGKREDFGTVTDLGRAVEERMKRNPGPWTASFGYITMIPRRTYFKVEFGPDARVLSVSETWAGRLD